MHMMTCQILVLGQNTRGVTSPLPFASVGAAAVPKPAPPDLRRTDPRRRLGPRCEPQPSEPCLLSPSCRSRTPPVPPPCTYLAPSPSQASSSLLSLPAVLCSPALSIPACSASARTASGHGAPHARVEHSGSRTPHRPSKKLPEPRSPLPTAAALLCSLVCDRTEREWVGQGGAHATTSKAEHPSTSPRPMSR